MSQPYNMPISDLLYKYYNQLKRNKDGTIVYDKQFKEVTENLLNLECLDSSLYSTYDAFFHAVTKGLINTPKIVNASNSTTYRIPEGSKSKYKYVNDVLTDEIWKYWRPGEQIFISAGTGRGKNTFIKKELLKSCGSQKVVIFENRQSLMQQQIIDVISEIDPEILKYQDLSEENMVIFGSYRNIMMISYQCAALKCLYPDTNFLDFFSHARYLIFDEAHYILDDAPYNKGISFFVQTFLENQFPAATKIFMSGTMEEVYEYVQLLNAFPEEPIDIIEEKKLLDEKGSNNNPHKLIRDLQHCQSPNSILSLPTDYSYIEPYQYKKTEDICTEISKSPSYEKWLIFVKSIEDGAKLKGKLDVVCNGSVCFLSSENKKKDENAEIYNRLIRECKFDCRVLIATTVIYNGINIKDDAVKHIVLPFTSMSVTKQLLGRKRMTENETVKVYFPDITYDDAKRRYRDCIRDCMDLISLNQNLQYCALCQLNGLVNTAPSKYYYLVPQQVAFSTMMMAILNSPAIYKLYYDTCFYIFVLQRLKTEQSDFVKILLTHLDIAEKYDDVTDITLEISDEKVQEDQAAFAAYLESLLGNDIISPDENGSFDKFLELKQKINEIYKIFHNGKALDTQWKNKERFFSGEKIQMFFSELDLPYEIESTSSKGSRITKVTRKQLQ
ncbi:MAG: DEAD/DEAH box helicase [Ruminococcus sp.]|jgi:putative helicase|nr:DEAD/DEAH box helicase [Ruminococcus sp.]